MYLGVLRLISLLSNVICGVLLSMAALWTSHSRAQEAFVIGRFEFEVGLGARCHRQQFSRAELSTNLAQYDPSRDPRSDIRDETPWSRSEIIEIKKQLVEDGFIYPNGEESVITWMDFDNDGVCDFTGTAGIGGMRSIDRMFLFRGVQKGQFKLVDSHLSFMEGSITIIPYIPVFVKGERVPLIIAPRDGRMLRWRSDGGGFEVCDANLDVDSPWYVNNVRSSDFRELCDLFWDIAENVEVRLPRENKVGSWGAS